MKRKLDCRKTSSNPGARAPTIGRRMGWRREVRVTGVESPSASMVEEKEDRLEAAPTPQEEVVTKKEWVGEEEKQEAALKPRKVRW